MYFEFSRVESTELSLSSLWLNGVGETMRVPWLTVGMASVDWGARSGPCRPNTNALEIFLGEYFKELLEPAPLIARELCEREKGRSGNCWSVGIASAGSFCSPEFMWKGVSRNVRACKGASLVEESSELSENWTSWVGRWGRSKTCGSGASTSAVSGATKDEAAATAERGIGAGAAASPTGTGAGAIGKRILTVTGGGSSVTFYVATTVVGGSNKEGMLSSNNVGSPR